MTVIRGYAVRLHETVVCEAVCQGLYAMASAPRREKADRYRHPEDRVRCLLGDGLLRYAARAAGVHDTTLSVALNAYGKPYLRAYPDLHYNMAHGGDWVVLVWDRRPVGVDVERVDANRDVRALAGRYFSIEEQTFVAACDTPRRFYDLWTAKEAYLKYRGTGFACGTETPDLRKDGLVTPTAYLRRFALSDGHILAVCGESAAVDVTVVAPIDLL